MKSNNLLENQQAFWPFLRQKCDGCTAQQLAVFAFLRVFLFVFLFLIHRVCNHVAIFCIV